MKEDLQARLHELQLENRSLQAHRDSLQQGSSAKLTETNQLTNELDKLRAQNEQWSAQVAEARGASAQLQSELSRTRNDLERLQQQHEHLQKVKDETLKEMSGWRERATVMESEKQKLQLKLNQKEQQSEARRSLGGVAERYVEVEHGQQKGVDPRGSFCFCFCLSFVLPFLFFFTELFSYFCFQIWNSFNRFFALSEAEIQRLRAELDAANRRYSDIAKSSHIFDFDLVNTSNDGSSDAVNNLKNRLNTVQAMLDAEQDKVENLERERDDARRQFEAQTDETGKLARAIDELLKDHEALVIDFENKSQEAREAKQQLDSVRAAANSMDEIDQKMHEVAVDRDVIASQVRLLFFFFFLRAALWNLFDFFSFLPFSSHAAQ
jgi:chromosome segregation ATPase